MKNKILMAITLLGLGALLLGPSISISLAQTTNNAATTATSTDTTTASTTTPIISDISATSSSDGTMLTVTWTTDQSADSQVVYGTNTFYGASTTPDTNMTVNHSVTLFGLTPETTYHFQIRSTNGSGMVSTSDDQAATTAVTSTGTATTTAATTTTATTTATSTTSVSVANLIAALQQIINQLQQQINMLQSGNLTGLPNTGGTSSGSTSTTTPTQTGTAMITPASMTLQAGMPVDFNGRGFGIEEPVNVSVGSQTIITAHADGGGNFTTGSMRVPGTPGTYTYIFTGASSGRIGTATVTVT